MAINSLFSPTHWMKAKIKMIITRTRCALIILICFIAGILFQKYITEITIFPEPEQIEAPPLENTKTPVDINEIKTGRVMFALVIGQSNAANYGEKIYKTKHSVYNYYKGRLYIAEDPLLEASGLRGSVWGMLGDSLIEKGYYDKVVFVSIAVGSTSIECWSDGRCSIILKETMDYLKNNNVKLTHIFWHQGEEDNLINTPADVYKSRLKKILKTIRSYGGEAPLFVSIASFNPWVTGKPEGIEYKIRRAQKEFIRENRKVYKGPDTDTIVSSFDRFDRVHFSESGMKKYSKLWLNAIINPQK